MQDITIFINNHPILVSAAFTLLIALIIVEALRARSNKNNVDIIQATQLINHDNAAVIDTRSIDLFRKGHIIDAISIPHQQISESKKLEKYKKRPIIIVCQGGVTSRKIADNLINQGYNAYSLSGGMKSWFDAEMPIVKES